MTLREIFEVEHPMFVELGRETDFFMTWVGDLQGNVTLEALNERSEINRNSVFTMRQMFVDYRAEEFGWVVEIEDEH